MTPVHSKIQLCTSQATGAVSDIAKAAAEQAANAAKEIVDNSSIFPQAVSNDVAPNKPDVSVMSELDELAQLTEEAEEKNSVSSLVDIIKGLITALQGILGANVADSVDNNKKVEATDETQTTNKAADAKDVNEAETGDIVDVNIAGIGEIEDAEVMDKAGLESYFDEIGFKPDIHLATGGSAIDMESMGGKKIYKITDEDGLSDKIYITNENNEIIYEAIFSISNLYNESRNWHVVQYTKDGEYYHAKQKSGMVSPEGGTLQYAVGMFTFTRNKEGKMIAMNGKPIN